MPTDPDPDTMVWAILKNRIDKVKKLIAGGTDVNETVNKDGETPLYLAALLRRETIAAKLIEEHAEVDKTVWYGMTPLLIAAKNGDSVMVEMLIRAGADVDKYDTTLRTPLFYAAQGGHIAVVEKLIEAGADKELGTTLDTGNRRPVDVATPLIKTYLKTTLLCIAAREGRLAVVEKLIAAGADVNKARTTDGGTPLYIAAYHGHLTVVTKLIAAGADVDKATYRGATPLHIVICNAVSTNHNIDNNINIMVKLLDAGANVNREEVDLVETAGGTLREKFRKHTEGLSLLGLLTLLFTHGTNGFEEIRF